MSRTPKQRKSNFDYLPQPDPKPAIEADSSGDQLSDKGIVEPGKSEKLIERLNRRNELVLDAAGEGILGLNLQGNHTFVNPAAARMLGYSVDELMYQHSHSMWHYKKKDGSPYPAEECPIYSAYKDGAVHRRDDEVFWRKDGTPFPVEYASTPILEDGKIVGAVVAFNDITERRQLEEKLRQYRDDLETQVENRTAELRKANRALKMLYECNQIIVHASNEEEFLRDICDTIVKVGAYRMAWVGYAEHDEKKSVRPIHQCGYGEGYLESLHLTWDDSEWGRCPMGTSIRTGEPYVSKNILTDDNFAPCREEALKRGYASSVAIPINYKSRTLGAINICAAEPNGFDEEEVRLLKEMSENIAYCILTLRAREGQKKTDEELREYREQLEIMVETRTKELKNTLDDLERSNADLKAFAHVASHDLKEPLRTIAGFARLLEKRYKDKLDEKGVEFIQFTIEGTERMDALIKDLLEYSEVGAREKEYKPAESSSIVRKAISNLQLAINESAAAVTYDDDLPTVIGDATLLTSLFQNLIGNAIKFRGAETPRVHISAARKEQQWVFSVRDNGIGIDRKFLENIFAPFKRLYTKDEYPGTGIGLATCKKVVEQHGGKIWVESQPGNGSVFYFTIPHVEEYAAAPRREGRIKQEIRFDFEYQGRRFQASTVNLSEKGLCIRVSGEPMVNVGDAVDLSIQARRFKAKVVWRKRLSDESLIGFEKVI